MRLRLIILIFVLSISPLFGQLNNNRFRQVSPQGGFTRDAIYSIAQDKLGYIWMGTRQGLIKYDTESTTLFTPLPNDTLSLPSEKINNVFTDNENNVWVATNRGLCLFDRRIQGFKKINYTYEDGKSSSNTILSALVSNEKKLLILDNNFFGYLDLDKKTLFRIGTNKLKSPSKLYKDNFNRIWVGTNRGEVYRYYPQNNELKKIIKSNDSKVNTILTENDKIWVGYENKGAKQYNFNGDLLKQHSFGKKNMTKKDGWGNVRVIKKDTYGRIWFGTYEGLYVDNGSEIIRFDPEDYPDIPHNSIYEIFEDRQGGIWIGTWSGGVALLHHSDNNIQTYQHNTFNNSISNNTISSFLQINKNELLIGTEVGGLNSLNLNTGRFDLVPISKNERVVNIKSLCKDKQGGLWVGTFKQGLWYCPANKTDFIHFEEGIEDGSHLSSSDIYSLCPVDKGVWIGTYGNGLNFYDFELNSIRFCYKDTMSDLSIHCLLEDSKSNLWIGSMYNYHKINISTGEIENFKQNPFIKKYGELTIYHIWEHESGDIWLGTKNNGILIFHPQTNTFENYDADGLLKGKNVYGIIEDSENNVWITSNNGLIVYNPKTNTNRHFVYIDGIQSNLFSPHSIYRDDNGILYLGGTNGFTKINPKLIKTNFKKPLTIINKIVTKNNKAIYPVYSNQLEINEIHLNPEENTFRIIFSADNYLMPEKNKYKYRMINYYNDWIDNQNNGTVLFTSLKAGEYIFEVLACNNDGKWNENPTQIKIVIKSYWYKTTLAYLIYIMTISSTLYLISRFYFERKKLKKVILLEKNHRENEEQIHEMKLKFFTNISHEFRTPLTLISWPLKRLILAENITTEQREEIEVVRRNSDRLLLLINQLIDFRKLDKGKSKLNISRIDLIKFIQELQKGFSSESKTKEIIFTFDSPFTSLEIEADEEKLDTIIYNLLSNAYKYIQQKGQIKMAVGKQLSIQKKYSNQLSFGNINSDDFIEITIADSGHGIDSEDLMKVFNRFEQGKQKTKKESSNLKGSGIGLSLCKEYTLLHHGQIIAQSTVGKGSKFTLLLPTKQKAQKVLFESHQEVKNLNKAKTPAIKLKSKNEQDKNIHILVVEDNSDFRLFICSFLDKYYQVHHASNGEEALSIVKNKKIDLVVSDVMMPKMDGFEFCEILKTQVETSHIPIILLTALSSTENLISGLDKGADAYLTKPFDENILITQIDNIILQRRRIHETFKRQFISSKTIEVSSLDNFFLNRVRSVVENNISDENFGMEKLAKELMISRSQLHRKIKSLSGVTSTEFVNLVRIKKAVELIEQQNYTFNEVSYLVGFSSQSYFTKCFKKVYEVTPKEYFSKKDER